LRTFQRFNVSTFLFSCVLSLAGLFFPASLRAQFVGYTAPQTNQQTLATNVNCTTGAQNFPISNFGQITHSAQITSLTGNPQTLSMLIQGSNDGVNFFPISDVLAGSTPAAPNPGITGSGYYPIVRVQMICTPVTATFSISYSGIAGSATPPGGAFYRATIEKLVFTAQSAGTTVTSFNGASQVSPFGNSAGVLLFSYSGTGPAGSQIQLLCNSFNIFPVTQISYGPFVLDTTTSVVQTFTIPPAPCPSYSITYTAGGASAATFQLDYLLTQPGTNPFPTMEYAPGQLGVNALVEPAAGTSALSNIIDTRGVRQATISFNCTAGAVTLNLQEYAENGSTTLALISPLSAVAASTNTQLTIGSESNPSSNVGTLSTSALIRFPQRALAFSFTNAGGAGTCTARLFLSY
jgi:hypothetical protein